MGQSSSKRTTEVATLQRLRYDMSSVHSSNPTFIWFLGLPGSGRTTHVRLLCEKLGFVEVRVVDLLREESKRDTDRGKIIYRALKGRIDRVPDDLVVDLVKEALLSSSLKKSSKGFIINNFPRTKKQAQLFVKEIKDVDVIFYLFADMATLINRLQGESPEKPQDADALKKKIVDYAKEVRASLSGMKAKNERVFTEAPITAVNAMLLSSIQERVGIKSTGSIAEAERLNS